MRDSGGSKDHLIRQNLRIACNGLLGVALLNLFPLPREAGFLKSFSYAGECVDRGYSVLVFPEGHHTTDGKLRPFRAGVGLLATRLGVPVVPMRIDGLFEVKQAGRKFAPPGKIQYSYRRARAIHSASGSRTNRRSAAGNCGEPSVGPSL